MSTLFCPHCIVWCEGRKRQLTKKRGLYRCSYCGETYSENTLDAEYARLQRASQVIANFYRHHEKEDNPMIPKRISVPKG